MYVQVFKRQVLPALVTFRYSTDIDKDQRRDSSARCGPAMEVLGGTGGRDHPGGAVREANA